jgi:hypothetical protein
MCKVREVYNYTSTGGISDNKIPLAAPSSSIGTTLTNTAEILNKVYPLYDTKKNAVGKFIVNENNSIFENNTAGYVSNAVYLFDDGSYVMVLKWVNNNSMLPPNSKYVNKAISTGGKYAGKDVTVTVKTDSNKGRKVILEYNN